MECDDDGEEFKALIKDMFDESQPEEEYLYEDGWTYSKQDGKEEDMEHEGLGPRNSP